MFFCLVGFLFPFKKGNTLIKWQLDSNWGIGLIMKKMLKELSEFSQDGSVFLCCRAPCRGKMGVGALLGSGSRDVTSWSLNYCKDGCALPKRVPLQSFFPWGGNKMFENKTSKILSYKSGKSGLEGIFFSQFLSSTWAESVFLPGALT